jgi:hypothetical protein
MEIVENVGGLIGEGLAPSPYLEMKARAERAEAERDHLNIAHRAFYLAIYRAGYAAGQAKRDRLLALLRQAVVAMRGVEPYAPDFPDSWDDVIEEIDAELKGSE